MAPISIFVRHKTDAAMDAKKYNVTCATKEPINTVKTFNDDGGSAPTKFDSGSDELPRKHSSERRLKRRHIEQGSKDVKRYWSSSKSRKGEVLNFLGNKVQGGRTLGT